METAVTADLSRFGYRELALASELLDAFITQGASFLGDGITLNFNSRSGYVFLSDDDYRVGLMDDDNKLREWYFCPECGAEGFDGDDYNGAVKLEFEENEGYCSMSCRERAEGD